jgi:hypothetical protein
MKNDQESEEFKKILALLVVFMVTILPMFILSSFLSKYSEFGALINLFTYAVNSILFLILLNISSKIKIVWEKSDYNSKINLVKILIIFMTYFFITTIVSQRIYQTLKPLLSTTQYRFYPESIFFYIPSSIIILIFVIRLLVYLEGVKFPIQLTALPWFEFSKWITPIKNYLVGFLSSSIIFLIITNVIVLGFDYPTEPSIFTWAGVTFEYSLFLISLEVILSFLYFKIISFIPKQVSKIKTKKEKPLKEYEPPKCYKNFIKKHPYIKKYGNLIFLFISLILFIVIIVFSSLTIQKQEMLEYKVNVTLWRVNATLSNYPINNNSLQLSRLEFMNGDYLITPSYNEKFLISRDLSNVSKLDKYFTFNVSKGQGSRNFSTPLKLTKTHFNDITIFECKPLSIDSVIYYFLDKGNYENITLFCINYEGGTTNTRYYKYFYGYENGSMNILVYVESYYKQIYIISNDKSKINELKDLIILNDRNFDARPLELKDEFINWVENNGVDIIINYLR